MLLSISRSSHPCQLTVIDNLSADQSISLIREQFPAVKINQMKENRVLCSFNEAVKQSEADIVFLLNNDLTADPDFIDPLINVFSEKKDAFMVAAKSFLLDHSYEGGRSIPFVKYGMFGTTCRFHGFENLMNQPGITFSAGFGAFDRKKFLELHGYDDLYLPGRMEDADLTFRAWRKGWKCYYQPKSVFFHMGAKSFKERFGERGTSEIAHRNTFLFMWKNITSVSCWMSHFFFLIPKMIWMLSKGRYEIVTGFLKALPRLKMALSRRHAERKIVYCYSDRQIFSFFRYGD